MSSKKIIIWAMGIDDLVAGRGKVGGLTVQMMFWAFTFQMKKFKVYTFSKHQSGPFEGIELLHMPHKKHFSLFYEIIYSIYYIYKIRPDIILFRGASRSLYLLSVVCNLLGIKLVFMGASDVNFEIGKENIAGMPYNKFLYRKGLKNTKYFAVQNKAQAQNLLMNYNKTSICIPNIWESKEVNLSNKELIIWIGNFRSLKRPEWFIRLARRFPDKKFVMAGYPSEKNLYLHCSTVAEEIKNITFLGPISFEESEKLFENTKLLVCTSEYEGFPNTFLQAWSRGIPVLSTVDPSNLISKKGLGYSVRNEHELYCQFNKLINDEELLHKTNRNINNYFKKSHDPKIYLEKLLAYIKTDKP